MKTCFVVQGFGKKTDYTDGRVLDLDASYAIVKEAVEAAGLECIRADEIPHSGTIDVPMYEMLMQADLVIADLSTYNVNAAFELGVRYGLRRNATIIVAEENFKNPFDVTHIAIRRYKHLGEDIGAKEAKRFREDLKQAIQDILSQPKTDSPVYTFLPGLQPPVLTASPGQGERSAPPAALAAGGEESPTAKALLDLALAKINPPEGQPSDFAGARLLLEEVRKQRPNDHFIIQQLALATYKSKQPTPEAALLAAREIMSDLNPATTNDPETLGLWGAVHKRLWELKSQPDDLAQAIAGHERGFYLKQDYYNGINLAFLLDLRAVEFLKAGRKDEGIADAVQARRVRREVIRYAEPLLARSDQDATKRYWIVATLWEAALGSGDAAEQARLEAELKAMPVPAWMHDTRQEQGNKLRCLQDQYAKLSAQTG
jgi:hypothetical protein